MVVDLRHNAFALQSRDRRGLYCSSPAYRLGQTEYPREDQPISMTFKHFVLAGAVSLALAAPAFAQAPARPATPITGVPASQLIARVNIPYEQFTLPNGLRVVVHTDRKAPIVAVSVWYDVGSTFEPAAARASRICSSI